MSQKYWRFLKYLVRQIKKYWKLKDSGIWELRNKHQHHLHSKFMCYIGVDRAIKIAQHFEKDNLIKKWLNLKNEIFEDIIKNGYNKKIHAFTMAYGSKDLDASVLHMAYHEFLKPNDPLLINTVKAIDKKLRKDCFVQRYKAEDDFGKSKSAFTICSFWLVDALYYIGEVKKARSLFKKLIKKSNHLGLFSEDIDLKTKKLVGNMPQGYTHLALINSSILLSEWSAKRKKIDWDNLPGKEF